MEEIFIITLQVFFEIIFNAIISLPFDWLYSSRHVDNYAGCGGFFFFLGLGAACGWLSLLLLPSLLITIPALRLVNLVIAPLLAGGMAVYLSARRSPTGKTANARIHFIFAFTFTLCFVAVRWAYAK